jgi:hypothetical protein
MPGWLYLSLCLVVPQIWAIGVALALAWWARRQRSARVRAGEPPDYSV